MFSIKVSQINGSVSLKIKHGCVIASNMKLCMQLLTHTLISLNRGPDLAENCYQLNVPFEGSHINDKQQCKQFTTSLRYQYQNEFISFFVNMLFFK